MTEQNRLEEVKLLLDATVTEWTEPEPNRLDGTISPERLLDAVTVLKYNRWGYLAAITGMDNSPQEGALELLYHFCEGAAVLTLRTALERDNPTIASICELVPYASPFERETGEMLGITFANTPDTSRLYLADDWPEGIYPLRKDADLEEVEHVNSE